MASSRALALRALQRWDARDNRAHAEQLVDDVAPRGRTDPRDRAHTNALVLGVLRNRSLLDHWLAGLLDRGTPAKLDPHLRRLLHLALFDLLLLGSPPHAAVDQAVSLAPLRLRALANALLRRAGRERDALLGATASLPLEVRFSHPPLIVDAWTERFGAAATETLLAWDNQPAPVYLRPNRLHPDPPAHPSDHPLGFFTTDALDTSLLDEGRVYAQDPSTAIAPLLVAPAPGERVLDACAAPGGKTALLAQLMQNSGAIVATDSAPGRLTTLETNLARLGVTIATFAQHDWTSGPAPDLGSFDAVLLDVPCSNTGVLRRRADARWRLTPDSLATLPETQFNIASNAVASLSPGGRLVYSTCSIEPAENERVVERLLAAHTNLTLVESRVTLPHIDGVDGAFAALLTSATST